MVEIDKKLYSDIKEYCKINNLIIKDFINKLLKQAFMVEKYGETPFDILSDKNKIVQVPIETRTYESPHDVLHQTVETPNVSLSDVMKRDENNEKNIEKKSKKRKL